MVIIAMDSFFFFLSLVSVTCIISFIPPQICPLNVIGLIAVYCFAQKILVIKKHSNSWKE